MVQSQGQRIQMWVSGRPGYNTVFLFCPEAGRTAGLSRTSVGEEFERQVGLRISCGMLISELRSQSGQANPMYSVLC
jgi:hypothetical protein